MELTTIDIPVGTSSQLRVESPVPMDVEVNVAAEPMVEVTDDRCTVNPDTSELTEIKNCDPEEGVDKCESTEDASDDEDELQELPLKGILKHQHIYGLDKKSVNFDLDVKLIPYDKMFYTVEIQIVKEFTKRVVSYRELFKKMAEEEKAAKERAAAGKANNDEDEEEEPEATSTFSHLVLKEPVLHHSSNDKVSSPSNAPTTAVAENDIPQDYCPKESNEVIVVKRKFSVTPVDEYLENQTNINSDLDTMYNKHFPCDSNAENKTDNCTSGIYEINSNVNDTYQSDLNNIKLDKELDNDIHTDKISDDDLSSNCSTDYDEIEEGMILDNLNETEPMLTDLSNEILIPSGVETTFTSNEFDSSEELDNSQSDDSNGTQESSSSNLIDANNVTPFPVESYNYSELSDTGDNVFSNDDQEEYSNRISNFKKKENIQSLIDFDDTFNVDVCDIEIRSVADDNTTNEITIQNNFNFPMKYGKVDNDNLSRHKLLSKKQQSSVNNLNEISLENSEEKNILATELDLRCQHKTSLTCSSDGLSKDFTQSTNLDHSNSVSSESLSSDDSSISSSDGNCCLINNMTEKISNRS